MTTPTWTLTDEALLARRYELADAIRRLTDDLERLTAVAESRGLTIPDTGPKRVVQHGTDSGYYTHLRRWHTEPCDDCRAAHAEATARRTAARRAARVAQIATGDQDATQRLAELDEAVNAA